MSLVECHPKTRQATVSQAQEVTNLHQHHSAVHCAVLAYKCPLILYKNEQRDAYLYFYEISHNRIHSAQ